MKLLTVVGARPQFIKAAVVSRAIAQSRSGIQEVIVHTGQHFDENMSKVFFDDLSIPEPNCNLGVSGGSHGQNTGRMLEKLEALMVKEKPDCVLVYGDTDSTLAAALAASKLHIRIAHVEAGLRSYNRRMPEEINRVLTDHMADLLFSPTETAVVNLRNEGIPTDRISMVGDVMYDAALYYRERAREPRGFDLLGVSPGEFVLCTIHRAENTDNVVRMQGILNGLGRSGVPIVLPLHPRTRKIISQMKLALPDNVHVIGPVGYLEMVWLEINCKLIATDSGGVQKEAYFHGKPCITLRDETEWVELVDAGYNYIVGCSADLIAAAIKQDFSGFSVCDRLYGDGHSSGLIVSGLVQ